MTNSEMEWEKYVLDIWWVENPSFYSWRGPGTVFGRLESVTDLQRIHHAHYPAIQQVDGTEIGTWKFQYPGNEKYNQHDYMVIFLFIFEIRIYNNSNNNDHET